MTRLALRSRYLWILAGIGLVAASMLLPQSSHAQIGGETPSIAVQGDSVWSASLTIGANAGLLGYSTFSTSSSGALSTDQFTWRGTTYRITNLLYNRPRGGSESWNVALDVTPALPDGYECLTLRLGDQWLNLADGRGNGRQFFWYDFDLRWRTGALVEVALREFPQAFEVRSLSGWGNNQDRPELGMANTQLLRKAAVPFDFAMSAAMPEQLPDPRTISNMLSPQIEPIINAAQASDMIWQWGQFVDHDISLTPSTVLGGRAAIPVPFGDPVFDPFRTGQRSMAFNRSAFDPSTGTGPDNPREQINEITTFIDGSNVYGSDGSRNYSLRLNDGTGRLKTSANGSFLPRNPSGQDNDNGGRPRTGLFLAGDIRANEQVGLTAMHTLFVREHNRLAEEIAERHPDLTGQEIFELARKVVGAQMQVITYQEFLPLLLGSGAIGPYQGYDSAVDPTIANEFSTAAYRVGHTMLSSNLLHIDASGTAQEISLAQGFFDPDLVRQQGIDGFLRGLATQRAQEVDMQLVDDIRNLLFGPLGSPGRDLAALNIQRGRDHGLPRYNVVRVAYGLPAVSSFADMSSDPAIQRALEQAYSNVEDVDLWIGGLAEDHMPGAMVGATFRAIIADQFRRLRDGDRYWFENDPYLLANPELLRELRSTTLADVIRRNTEIGDELAANVFGGPPPSISVATLSASAQEGAAARFTLTRSGPTSHPLTIDLHITETGTMLDDSLAVVSQATFDIGSDMATLILNTSDDGDVEHDSMISVTIVESGEYGVGADSASLTVKDDDSTEIRLASGWNTIEWTGADGVDVGAALRGSGDATNISSDVTAVYEWIESSQTWRAYFPVLDGVASINNLASLRSGHTYLIATNAAVRWRIPLERIPLPQLSWHSQ